jgi:hypothetical protein
VNEMANNAIDLAVALFDLATLFLLTQTKAHNIPIYALFRLQFFFLSKSCAKHFAAIGFHSVTLN